MPWLLLAVALAQLDYLSAHGAQGGSHGLYSSYADTCHLGWHHRETEHISSLHSSLLQRVHEHRASENRHLMMPQERDDD